MAQQILPGASGAAFIKSFAYQSVSLFPTFLTLKSSTTTSDTRQPYKMTGFTREQISMVANLKELCICKHVTYICWND
jgi:hypothetical protein